MHGNDARAGTVHETAQKIINPQRNADCRGLPVTLRTVGSCPSRCAIHDGPLC